MPLIEARDLSVGHAGLPVLRGVGLRHHGGRVVCLLGPNGVGKTTLFRTLLGLIPPISGDILLSGRPLATLSPRERAAYLAYVPQSLTSPFAYSALDIVLMGAAARLGPFARPGPVEVQAAMGALEHLGIADLAQRDVTRLSGGQRQLVLVARALAQATPTVVMDEPTASLDLANRRRVEAAIRDLAGAGSLVILSTHDPNQAALLAEEALLVGHGGILAAGPSQQVLTAELLSQLYGTELRQGRRADGISLFY